jgi:hypothetical protein
MTLDRSRPFFANPIGNEGERSPRRLLNSLAKFAAFAA